jgi:hypothetical protein
MAVTTRNTPLVEQMLPGTETRHVWVIDLDHNATTTAKSTMGNLAGVGGPKGRTGLPIEKPDRYRILDVDGKPMLEGRTNAASIAADSDGKVDGFEPMDDISIGKYIEYLRGDKWVRLREGE